MEITILIEDAEASRELYLIPVFQCLLLVLKPVSVSNFIDNNQSFPTEATHFYGT